MTANELYSKVVGSQPEMERIELSHPSPPPPPPTTAMATPTVASSSSSSSFPSSSSLENWEGVSIRARFDARTSIRTPPCMTTAKIASRTFDFKHSSEIWPHDIWNIQLNINGTNWERLLAKTPLATPAPDSPPASAEGRGDPRANSHPKHPRLTIDELKAARPHTNSFFCPIEWRWLAYDLVGTMDSSCPCEFKYHFFEHYRSAVDQIQGFTPVPLPSFDQKGRPTGPPTQPPPIELKPEERWDARICHHCRRGIIITPPSGSVPSVFRREEALEMIRHSRNYTHAQPPGAGPTKPEQLVYKAWHTVFIVVQNALVEGKLSPLPLNGKSISGRMPWDPISQKIWASLGVFCQEETELEKPAGAAAPRPLLVLPNLNVRTPEGRNNRAIWVRALLEVSVFLKWWKIQNPQVDESLRSNYIVPILLTPALPLIVNSLGGNNIPTIPVQTSWQSATGQPVGYSAYSALGILPNVPDQVVILAYKVQTKCYLKIKHEFFEALREVKGFRDGSCDELDLFIGIECSNGAVGVSEVKEAWRLICGENVEVDLEKDELMASGYNSKLENIGDDSTEKAKLREALRVLVEVNPDSTLLKVILDSSNSAAEPKPKTMDLNKAYATLGGVAPETDDDFLWMAYTIGISDQPGQKDLLKSALEVIAEHRNSHFIKSKLGSKTSGDRSESMDIVPYVPPDVSYDLPAGLNNIGNTCYLKELREVLLRFPDFEQDVEQDSLKEKKRVGGRIVSTPEIVRSKQFASQLQALFNEMIHTPSSAVTPERELAFLALVLSKDESPTGVQPNNQDSSASTDATLVDERPGFIGPVYNPPLSSSPPAAPAGPSLDFSSATVLGKRKSESSGSEDGHETGGRGAMEVDPTAASEVNDKSHDVIMAGSTPVQSEPEPPKAPMVIDLTIEDNGKLPPPLPPRPDRGRSLTVIDSGSHMMFGRQNDVSECMDNCLFQIQAALDDEKLMRSRDSGEEGNIVKSLFYGKTRQSLVFENPEGKISVKEEPFAYLLVDVAEEGRDLYDGLDRVFDESEVELENGKANRRVGLVDLPPILQIQLQRVQFDRKTHTVFKSNAYIKFEERLRMDRYLEPDPNDSVAQEKRSKTISRRKQIESLRGRSSELTMNIGGDKRPASTVLRDLHGILSSNGEKNSGSQGNRMEFFQGILERDDLDYLDQEARLIDEEIKTIDADVKKMKEEVEEMWTSPNDPESDRMEEEGAEVPSSEKVNRTAEYRLVSLFIHRGTANGGHYWAIQRQLPDKPDRWLKYNDSVVTEVDPEIEVFGNHQDSTANPYWLTYVRVGEENRFEMVNRQVISN